MKMGSNVCLNSKGIFFFFIFLLLGIVFTGVQNLYIYGEDTGLKYSRNFSPADYDHKPQNWCIVQDKNSGIIYVANNGGLLEYDGVSWRLIKVPNWYVRSLAWDDDGTLYIGGNNELGYLSPRGRRQDGKVEYISLTDQVDKDKRDFSNVWHIHSIKGSIYFNTGNYLFGWNPVSEKMKVWTAETSSRFNAIFKCGGRLFVRQQGIGLREMKDGSLKTVSKDKIFAEKKVSMMVPHKDGKLLIGTRSSGLYLYSGITGKVDPFPSDVDDYLKMNTVYRGIQLKSSPGDIALATLRGGLVVINSRGRLKYKFNKTTGLQNDNVKHVCEDTQGNLWLALERGVSKIEYSSPFFIYDSRSDLPGLVLSVVRHGDVLYAGTTWGLFIADSPFKKFAPLPGMNSSCWSLLSVEDSVMAATDTGVFQIRRGIPRNVIAIRSYVLVHSRQNPNRIWVGTSKGLASLYRNSQNDQWTVEQDKYNQINQLIKTSMVEDQKSGSLWIGSENRGVLNVDLKQTRERTQLVVTPYDHTNSSLPQDYVYAFMAAGHVMFATREGIFRFDEKEGVFIPDETFGELFAGGDGRRAVFRIAEDKNKDIWFHSLSENFLAQQVSSGKYVIRSQPFRRVPLVQVNVIYPDPDGINVWFGSDDGLIRCDTGVKKDCEIEYATLIRDVRVNGISLLYDEENYKYKIGDDSKDGSGEDLLVIPHRDRNIQFKCAASFFEAESENHYRYKLEGYDESWSTWNKQTQIEYTNLDGGTYTFRVEARNVYRKSGYEDIFEFRVLPPWYKNWWAVFIYAFLLFWIIFFIVKWRSWRLEQEKQKLERIVEERTSEINQKSRQLETQTLQLIDQSEKLKEMDRVKSRFFANISHEFRTPLTLIMGPLEQMLSQRLDRNYKDKFNLMLRNSQKLLTLINQLLDLSRFDSGKMKLQAAHQNIIPFLKGIMASFEQYAVQKKLELTFIAENDNEGEDICLYFDSRKMEQVVTNLLVNAVKFTPARGKITISVKKGHGEKEIFPVGYVEISVADTGIGIPKEKLPYIFDRFYQVDRADSGSQAHKGTGIGLALTREVILMHHGKIDVHSTEGKGTEFVIRLPLGDEHLQPDEVAASAKISLPAGLSGEIMVDPMPGEEEEQEEKEAGSEAVEDKECAGLEVETPGKNVILVVEDNPDVRKYVREPLEPLYTVIEAKDGKEGIAGAKEIIPDLVVSDIMMPEADGYELCRVLKKDRATSHIPIILLTAKASEESMIQGLETGADDYITKPFNTKILCVRIKNLIDLRRQLQLKIQRQKMLLPAEIDVSSLDERFLKEFQEIIEKNLSDPDFNIEELCKQLYMARATLFRKVQAMTGDTPNQFIQSYRLERAAQLLKANFGNVTEVAFAVGFSNSAYFTRCFREKFHQLPSSFLASES